MDKFSYLSGANADYIEDLYRQYLKDPSSLDETWLKFFEGFEFARKNYDSEEIPEEVQKEFRVINLINGYRSRGHLFTKTNPVRERRKYSPTLDIGNFGLKESDLDIVFQAGSDAGIGPATLRQIIIHLEKCYCQSIGVEYMYMRHPETVGWLQDKVHYNSNLPDFSAEQKKHILKKLNQAVVFEQFLHSRFPGQKRFSLEGSESLIPALDALIVEGAALGIHEITLGMAHRGRLNVLANIFGKTYKDIFSEFEPKDYSDEALDGDVKYHLGFSCDYHTDHHSVHMDLSPNPSHLESADPIVEGIARAKIENQYEDDESKILPVLIHGDAAIAGQGVVYEMVQMAQLDGYRTGGTIHIVINNQVGFTTNYIDARSSTYCTDVGKVTLCPVFHVNGDDPEALVHVIKIAVAFRQQFHQDVFIDLLSYRKYGHNEGDEPKFTQPLLYKAIAKHPNPRDIYLEQLLQENVIDESYGKTIEEEFKEFLQLKFDESKAVSTADIDPFLEEIWNHLRNSKATDFLKSPDTGVDVKLLKNLGARLTEIPKGKVFFRKMQRILSDRKKMIEEGRLDWGMAELLAYASLLVEGHAVRISGQDCERGTFSHRHAIVKVEDDGEEYCHLQHLQEKQGQFNIYNSSLSEYGVLGFDYGYSLATPDTLTIWEAQFGDFGNAAQIIIDQFISSAEDKWRSQSGIILYLPHGYEGMGPEHSSARMERFLTLAGEFNMQVVNCTTPGNFFHVLRRQLKREFRKPLVVFTPKSLLRHPRCVSSLEDLAQGGFKEVIDDTKEESKNIETLALCQGKIYYELLNKKEELNANDITIVRIEQLYPFPQNQIDQIIERYKSVSRHIWVQEEPENMGAWSFILRNFKGPKLELISRPESASPASGSPKRAQRRQTQIIDKVFQKHLAKVTA